MRWRLMLTTICGRCIYKQEIIPDINFVFRGLLGAGEGGMCGDFHQVLVAHWNAILHDAYTDDLFK